MRKRLKLAQLLGQRGIFLTILLHIINRCHQQWCRSAPPVSTGGISSSSASMQSSLPCRPAAGSLWYDTSLMTRGAPRSEAT